MMPGIRYSLFLFVAVALLSSSAVAAPSIWKSAPRPKFPAESLRRGTEGYVIIRGYIAADGTVTRTTVARSSGDSVLDETARTAVLKWKMNPAAIKPDYLTKGYDQRIDFKQETAVIARYRDRTAYFESFDTAKVFTSAAFPEYPYQARRGHIEGVAYVKFLIGPDGRMASVQLAKSSGNVHLDDAALNAVRSWRAHKEFAGMQRIIPIRFTLQGLR